jgi:hypothetical protein
MTTRAPRLRSLAVCLVSASLAAIALTGCSDDEPPPEPDVCKLFLGDPELKPEIEIRALTIGPGSVPLADGDGIDIITPPQGGRVVFAGARAKNLCAKGVQLSGSLRDPPTGQIRFEGRTINLDPGDDGWGSSVDEDISTFTNIPVCPNQWSSRDIFDQDYELTLSVKDRDGLTATRTVTVRPACAEPALSGECRCICKAGYVLGEPCL